MERADTQLPSEPRADARSGGRSVALVELGAIALLVLLWVEVLRVWLPSLVFSGAEGRFSATTLLVRGVALSLVVTGLTTLLVRRLRPAGVLLAGGALLVVGRSGAALAIARDADPSLYAAVGVAAGAAVILGLAADGHEPRRARIGIVTGLALAVLLHAVTDTVGLLWAPTRVSLTLGTALAVLGSGSVLALAWRSRARSRGRPLDRPAAAWPWWLLVPTVLLVLGVTGVPGRIATTTGWDTPRTVAAVVALHLVLLIATMVPSRWPGLRVNGVVVVALPTATLAVTATSGWSELLGLSTISIALGLLVGAPEPRATGAAARTRAAVAGLAVVTVFAALGLQTLSTRVALVAVDADRIVLLVALLGAVLAWRTAREPRNATLRARAPALSIGVALVVGVALTAAAAALAAQLPATPGQPQIRPLDAQPQLRVGLYNVRHGFDLHGRFAAHRQADLLRDLDLDVLVLNDVDRGWLATGGHDALRILSRELGFSQVLFGAGGDPLYGNALLTRAEVLESASDRLPAVGEPLRGNQVAAVIAWPRDEDRLGIVGTHLSEGAGASGVRVPQARAVAGTVALLRERQVPTVMLGDLNAPPGSTELSTFATLLDDALPDGVVTYPADDPSEHLDHVLVSPELRRVGLELPSTTWSDHLPVVVTLELRDAP